MEVVKNKPNQERIVYGPNVTPQSRYVENPPK